MSFQRPHCRRRSIQNYQRPRVLTGDDGDVFLDICNNTGVFQSHTVKRAGPPDSDRLLPNPSAGRPHLQMGTAFWAQATLGPPSTPVQSLRCCCYISGFPPLHTPSHTYTPSCPFLRNPRQPSAMVFLLKHSSTSPRGLMKNRFLGPAQSF